MATSLAVGFAVYGELPQLKMTIKALQFFHANVMHHAEIIVLNNNPKDKPTANAMRSFCGAVKARYIELESPVGPMGARDEIFRQSTSEFTLILDPHVFMLPQSMSVLQANINMNRDSKDMWQGPRISDNPSTLPATHLDDTWGPDFTHGQWAEDPRGQFQQNEPFEIRAQGMGLFGCFTAAWPYSPPGLRGWGGSEGMLHEKFRLLGHKVLCWPNLQWWHLARTKGEKTEYPLEFSDRFRNGMIWRLHLKLPVQEYIELFEKSRLGKAGVAKIITELPQVPEYDSGKMTGPILLPNDNPPIIKPNGPPAGVPHYVISKDRKATRVTPEIVQKHQQEKRGLGDKIEQALTAVGITKERVEKFVGAPCGCAERREKLNRLGAWASRVLFGKTENAEKYLEEIISDGEAK